MKNILTPIQHNSKQQLARSLDAPLLSLLFWVCLPVRISLRLHPHNTLLSSVEEPVKLYITAQELQTIETRMTQQHLTLEVALIEYLKQTMQEQQKWQELIKQVQQWYGKETSVMIEVEWLR